ncbi:Nif3-like dinuclear metal center hexameric protein [Bifidobacterium sp. DSM 109959]|uniref:GTP cyclohydrolase 1 type 2 homolog n=2 Tax=Bifidobacterium olomucense TaxID=2675324 RepID=A0A7Y0EXK2_9BIFI|nr:Nif3-like dinuclear metal center hexameric protein [Bifidobacterium sp. DSM 109959]
MWHMPNLKQVIDVLETLYPLRYAEQWDEPGLIVGDLSHDVRKIVFAVDPTSSIVDKAIEAGADLLVTHHPLYFRAVHETGGLGFRGDIVRRLYQNGCGLWVGHTNADASPRGVGQAAADAFGLIDQRPLVPIDDPQSTAMAGLGRVGRLPQPVLLKDFALSVFKTVNTRGMTTKLGIQVCGDLDELVETVAVLPGSGDSLFDEVRAAGVDVYVTSDLRHHPATDAIEQARYEARMRAHGIMLGEGDARLRPNLINTPHAAIESMWFNYAIEDVPLAIEQATGQRPEVEWIHETTDPWTLTITSEE